MENIIGLKEFREDVQKVAEGVAKGREYVVVKRSQPLFRIVSAKPFVGRLPESEINAWKKLGGLLKGRKIPDPVKWQKQIRAESERKFNFPRTI